MSLKDKMTGIGKEKAIELLKKMEVPNQLLKEVQKSDELFDKIIDNVKTGESKMIPCVIFCKIPNLPHLINAEGGIFEIVEGNAFTVFNNKFSDSKHLFLKGRAEKGLTRIYTKINTQALDIYFQGRITLKELFLLRVDEPFILETRRGSNSGPAKYTQDFVFYDEYLDRTVFRTLECGNEYYFQLQKGMRLENPTKEVLDVLYNRFSKK